jgi:hypothetical protein
MAVAMVEVLLWEREEAMWSYSDSSVVNLDPPLVHVPAQATETS